MFATALRRQLTRSCTQRFYVQPRIGAIFLRSLSSQFTSSPSNNSALSSEASREVTRLTYHSRKRGILETTLILSRFAEDHLPLLSSSDRADYELLIMSNDWSEWDLYRYLTADEHRLDAPDEVRAWPVFWKIREMIKQEGGVVARSLQ